MILINREWKPVIVFITNFKTRKIKNYNSYREMFLYLKLEKSWERINMSSRKEWLIAYIRDTYITSPKYRWEMSANENTRNRGSWRCPWRKTTFSRDSAHLDSVDRIGCERHLSVTPIKTGMIEPTQRRALLSCSQCESVWW